MLVIAGSNGTHVKSSSLQKQEIVSQCVSQKNLEATTINISCRQHASVLRGPKIDCIVRLIFYKHSVLTKLGFL